MLTLGAFLLRPDAPTEARWGLSRGLIGSHHSNVAIPAVITSEIGIETRNKINAQAMQMQADVIAILAPYVGKKVRKISGYGGWVAALQKGLNAYGEALPDGVFWYLRCDYRWINLEAKTTYPVSECAVNYVKATVPVGFINEASGVLESVARPTTLRTDYTAEWASATRAEAARLEAAARELRSQLRELD